MKFRPLEALATVGFVYAATPDFHRAHALGAAFPSVIVAPFLLSLAGNVAREVRTKYDAAIAIVLYVATLTTVIALRPKSAFYIFLMVGLSIAHPRIAKRVVLLGGAIGALSVTLMTAWYSETVGGTSGHAVSDGISAFLFVGAFETLKAAADPIFAKENGTQQCVVASSALAWVGAVYTFVTALLLTRHLPAKLLGSVVSLGFVVLGLQIRIGKTPLERLVLPMKGALLLGIAAMYFE